MKTDRRLNRMIQSETRADGGEVKRCQHCGAETELQTPDVFQIRFDAYDRSRPVKAEEAVRGRESHEGRANPVGQPGGNERGTGLGRTR